VSSKLLVFDHRERSLIVSALSRSAQFWSSYSGYLREIREPDHFYVMLLMLPSAQLCFAFRRWMEIGAFQWSF
jgi:hypothetical protein